ncbi:hypothetical protein GBA52_005696 [Prunus armeniaca]|nr:hypothetical protein GBA52_005696 [Prunus armeniaca]
MKYGMEVSVAEEQSGPQVGLSMSKVAPSSMRAITRCSPIVAHPGLIEDVGSHTLLQLLNTPKKLNKR